MGPWMNTVSRARAEHSSAMATPIFPVDGFDMNRTGSIHSRVGPPVTIAFLSFNCIDCGPVNVFHVGELADSLVSAHHFARCRLDKVTPQYFSFSMFSLTAGCAYMFGFMAGAIMTGQVTERNVVESRSSAMPLANLPMMLAVAGATRKRDASVFSSIWPISRRSREYCSLYTGLPDRVSSVSGDTRCRAFSVAHHVDRIPSLDEEPDEVAGLVGRD